MPYRVFELVCLCFVLLWFTIREPLPYLYFVRRSVRDLIVVRSPQWCIHRLQVKPVYRWSSVARDPEIPSKVKFDGALMFFILHNFVEDNTGPIFLCIRISQEELRCTRCVVISFPDQLLHEADGSFIHDKKACINSGTEFLRDMKMYTRG